MPDTEHMSISQSAHRNPFMERTRTRISAERLIQRDNYQKLKDVRPDLIADMDGIVYYPDYSQNPSKPGETFVDSYNSLKASRDWRSASDCAEFYLASGISLRQIIDAYLADLPYSLNDLAKPLNIPRIDTVDTYIQTGINYLQEESGMDFKIKPNSVVVAKTLEYRKQLEESKIYQEYMDRYRGKMTDLDVFYYGVLALGVSHKLANILIKDVFGIEKKGTASPIIAVKNMLSGQTEDPKAKKDPLAYLRRRYLAGKLLRWEEARKPLQNQRANMTFAILDELSGGTSLAEIAEFLGISTSSVWSLIKAAKLELDNDPHTQAKIRAVAEEVLGVVEVLPGKSVPTQHVMKFNTRLLELYKEMWEKKLKRPIDIVDPRINSLSEKDRYMLSKLSQGITGSKAAIEFKMNGVDYDACLNALLGLSSTKYSINIEFIRS